jgi:hypothetical protein
VLPFQVTKLTQRGNVLLPGLDAPVAGVQVLSGEFVAVTDHETPDVDPPAENTGTDFDYNARSNATASSLNSLV